MTTHGPLRGPRSKSFIGSYHSIVLWNRKTLDPDSERREDEKVWDFCLDYCCNELLVGAFRFSWEYCCFGRIVGRDGNLTPQPWIATSKGSAVRVWLAPKRRWMEQLFNWFSLPVSGWHSQCCSAPQSYNYSMWSLLGPVLPGLMTFPKVWRLHVSLSLFVPRFVLLTLLMAVQAQQNLITNCVCVQLCGCVDELSIHRSCLTHILEHTYAVLLQMRDSATGSLLTPVWLCSGLTKAMLTLHEIHS